ncbi:adenine phosphoribosyltransferase [Bifidobacterium bohemicum]|uniref:Adenine phosphoribosyltransferase n=1 Tax=Bifidobacterium bohemicum DSM 22767 TaxID=1437606 RepID=A0A086ZJ61_9BIFI|nr:adenine phosphoribosyltransferase [Bifidobacterium bohemicum]KFI46561.1 adenine phosphoribosyltransferase [Bifidobacterium bohemicum DSM 22767]SCB75176.1 adenine phosphoribosyltransferase [Bifidobacterium bohemicum]
MSGSDITINGLKKVGEADAEYLVSLVRSVPGFPNENVLFRDFMPVLADARGFQIMMKALELALPVPISEFDYVAGLEARGFLIGPTLAYNLGKGFVAVRKAGKLPPETIGKSYDLEYGQARVEIEQGTVKPGDRVLIVDDLIATSGTAQAAADLIEQAGGKVVGFSFVMELIGLNGRGSLGQVPCSSLITMHA